MTINLISCVANFNNKLAIGRGNDLLFRLKEDLMYFKNITTNLKYNNFPKFTKNVVLMGRKTWYSIPNQNRPLSNRLNLVLTNEPNLHKLSPYPISTISNLFTCKKKNYDTVFNESVYFITFKQFLHFYKLTKANVFVIGGAQIYNTFLKHPTLKPNNLYITEVLDYKPDKEHLPDTFMDHFDQSYKLNSISNKKYDTNAKLHYRHLIYHQIHTNKTDENTYLHLCKIVLANGRLRDDRTGVGTIGIFGKHLEFDISDTVPLLTTKRVAWKHCIEELLWFIRGDTDAKILQKKGVKIWDLNTSREFLDSRNLQHYETGILGPGYGWQWRFFGANYSQSFADTSKLDTQQIGGFDQLNYVLNELKTNPFSRRIMMCYWNPPDFDKTALLPCHFSCQFYVDVNYKGEHILNCHFNMRSNDVFLGLPFNIFSYTVLTYIMAIKCDMKPGKLLYTGGDVHIYKNHVAQVESQLLRNPRPLPKLIVNSEIKSKDWKDITLDDFDIAGYFPHGFIKAPMAV